MKLTVIIMLILLFCNTAVARTIRVKPYSTKNGTYVQGHYKTSSDNTKLNNWSSKGNINPYTGKRGYTNPFPTFKP